MRQVHGLSKDGQNILLKKFSGKIEINASLKNSSSQYLNGIFLDTETTGLNVEKDKIIDLAYIFFLYDKTTGQIVEIKKEFSQLNDPKQPLSDIIKKITGYRDEDLIGNKIDWLEVENDFKKAHIIIAHNASFDRPFLDSYLDISKEKVWCCSMSQIDWKAKGHGSVAIEYLAKDHGYFFDGHRALNDVKATLHLITMTDPDVGHSYLLEILQNARKSMKWVFAIGASFSLRSELKNRGYQWDADRKIWKIRVLQDSREEDNYIKNHPLIGSLEVQPIAWNEQFR